MNGTVADARRQAMPETNARKRIALLLDTDSFVEIDGFVTADDTPTGVVCGYGAVMGSPVAIFAQDSAEQNGAVGAAHAAKIGKVYDLALKTGIPLVGIYDSHGARLAEGVGSLAAYGDMLRSANNLSGVVPQIALVLGPCAGLSAMMACSADLLVMSRAGELFLEAPAADQAASADAAAQAGVAHMVCDDDNAACESVRRLLSRLPLNNLATAPVSEYAAPASFEDKLQAACNTMPETDPAAVAAALCDQDSLLELLPQFGTAAYTAFATMAGYPCGVVATKGRLNSDACAKIAKMVSLWDAYQIPIITLVNTEGLENAGDAQPAAAVRDMARMAHVYAEATTAKVAVITGAAYGSAYVALAGRATGSDYTLAWPSAVISPLPPQTAVAFLHSDTITADTTRAEAETAYMENEASPYRAAAGGYIDDVIDPALTRPALLSALDLLSAKRTATHPKKHGNLPL